MIAVLLVAIAACSKEDGAEVIVPQPEQENSFRVSVGDALRSAEAILNSGDRTTRSVERKVKSTEIYVAKPATRSNDDVEVSFYLINYEDNAGYALVSTDKRATPVYMYADEGNITTEAFEEVPPMAIFMEEAVANYEAEVASSGTDGPVDITPPPGIDGHMAIIDGIECYLHIDTTIVTKGPFCSATLWRQDEPYNFYCFQQLVGCGSVAMGQIMAYYQYPSSYDGYTFNWEVMLSQSAHYLNTDTGLYDIARLLKLIGDTAGAVYEGDETSSSNSIEEAYYTFDVFGYQCSSPMTYNQTTAIAEFNANRPIYVRGVDPTRENDPHAWVIDGYERRTYRNIYRYTTPPYDIYKTINKGEVLYLSHNSGYGGYYALDVDPFSTYSQNKRMLINIQPDNNE